MEKVDAGPMDDGSNFDWHQGRANPPARPLGPAASLAPPLSPLAVDHESR